MYRLCWLYLLHLSCMHYKCYLIVFHVYVCVCLCMCVCLCVWVGVQIIYVVVPVVMCIFSTGAKKISETVGRVQV